MTGISGYLSLWRGHRFAGSWGTAVSGHHLGALIFCSRQRHNCFPPRVILELVPQGPSVLSWHLIFSMMSFRHSNCTLTKLIHTRAVQLGYGPLTAPGAEAHRLLTFERLNVLCAVVTWLMEAAHGLAHLFLWRILVLSGNPELSHFLLRTHLRVIVCTFSGKYANFLTFYFLPSSFFLLCIYPIFLYLFFL